MQIVIRGIRREQTENIAGHRESDDCDDAINDTEDDQIQARERFAGSRCGQGEDTAQKVNAVMHRIDFKQAEDRIVDEAENADHDEDDTEQPGKFLDHR